MFKLLLSFPPVVRRNHFPLIQFMDTIPISVYFAKIQTNTNRITTQSNAKETNIFFSSGKILEKNPNYQADEKASGDTWKSHFNENPNLITYGNGDAEVIDYGMFDEKENYISVLENDREVILKSKIKFHKDVKDPIFTMTVKDFKGLEMCGTNTLIEKIATGDYKKGEIVEVSFKQKINVAPGKYTLSFSCTHFDHRGELEVLDRKYDALLIEVLSTKDTVGLMRLDSNISIQKVQ